MINHKKLLIFWLPNITILLVAIVTINCCEIPPKNSLLHKSSSSSEDGSSSKKSSLKSKKNKHHGHNRIKIPSRFEPGINSQQKIRSIKLSHIDTTEKCKKFKNIDEETVIVLCNFCPNKSFGTLWVARYKAIEHRKEQHLICECGKQHETSYAASHCEDCH